MLIYKTDRPNSCYFFIQLLTTVVIVSLPIVYDLLLQTTFVKETYYWVVGALIVMRIVDETSKERLIEFRFDTDNNQLIFVYRTLLFAARQKSLPLEHARLEIAQGKSSWTWLSEPMTLYFLKNKKEVFQINRSKDGFCVDKLREIVRTVGILSLPITKC